ncbi:hypothetical protein OAU66_01030 [bacterium]|nr:hypothetical protein [bacterium]
MNNFIHFTDIDHSDATTWQNKRVLSFDVDWAIDEVIEDVISMINKTEVKCTFFVTHYTPILEKMRSSPNIELGIHPNFNPLIDKEVSSLTAKQTITKLMEIVPEAKVLRSHSMTHSARWLSLYKEFGITHLSQYYMNGVDTIQPFLHVNGLTEVPVYFADDGYIFIEDHQKWQNKPLKSIFQQSNYIQVYNFHPIHVSLNTNSFSFYNETKPHHQNWSQLQKMSCTEKGVKNILENLINN